MTSILDIAEVSRRTGVTARALRFYEARGLVRPLRTASGRRIYDAAALVRLHKLLSLKRIGLTLAQIGVALDGSADDFAEIRALLAAQIEVIDARESQLADVRAVLTDTLARIDRGDAIDGADLCTLIRAGTADLPAAHWHAVVERYFTPAEKAEWTTRMADVPDRFDQPEYGAKWKALTDRIAAALPLDPTSDAAQAFVDEWFALLKPFSAVATPAMWSGAKRLYDDMSAWEGRGDPGFSPAVWTLIREATRARVAAGGTVDGPEWMKGSTT